MQKSKFKGIFEDPKKRQFYTKSIAPGIKVYGEKIIKEQGNEFREWNARKSKLAAALQKKISQIGILPGDIVLYLGCSYGTTPSHISDMVGGDGFVFALDFAPRVMRDMVHVAEQRPNIAPIMADAHRPETYEDKVCLVDAVYQDIAQRDQVNIFLKNTDKFLKKGGFGILFVKARSIDVAKKPKAIYQEVKKELAKHITIVDFAQLDPLEKDHCVFVCKK